MERRALLWNAFGIGSASATIAACRRVPLQQEMSGEFTGRGTTATRADRLRRAGAEQGWSIETRAPGVLRGALVRRDHQAVVDIVHDARRATIRYAGSGNLNYDGRTINADCNTHVQRRAIVAQPAIRCGGTAGRRGSPRRDHPVRTLHEPFPAAPGQRQAWPAVRCGIAPGCRARR